MSERFHLWKCERYKACDDERPPVALLSSASADFTQPPNRVVFFFCDIITEEVLFLGYIKPREQKGADNYGSC